MKNFSYRDVSALPPHCLRFPELLSSTSDGRAPEHSAAEIRRMRNENRPKEYDPAGKSKSTPILRITYVQPVKLTWKCQAISQHPKQKRRRRHTWKPSGANRTSLGSRDMRVPACPMGMFGRRLETSGYRRVTWKSARRNRFFATRN